MLSRDRVAAWFDFFWTRPYETFDINSRFSIETTVLLLVIGAAVTELAVWGRRQHTVAARRAGYLEGLNDTAAAMATAWPAWAGRPPAERGPRALAQGRCRRQLRRYFSAASGANTTTNPAAQTSDQLTRYPAVCPISSSAARPWDSARTASTM
jgi:hypothetical protein